MVSGQNEKEYLFNELLLKILNGFGVFLWKIEFFKNKFLLFAKRKCLDICNNRLTEIFWRLMFSHLNKMSNTV